ncbi:MAG: EamA family transporter [Saprospiraceae bacterium]|nr:EamA family transporter [Saprospiraceae bacterium]
MSENNSIQKWIYIFLLAMIWGSSFILIKKGLLGFGYIEAASIRMMSAGLLFIIPAIFHFKNIPHNKWTTVVLVSL